MNTDYDLNFRERPECYEIGRGEEGVFKVQPYKSELLPLGRYKDGDAARESSAAIWAKFEAYREAEDPLTLPLYAAWTVLEDFCPEPGTEIEGTCWMQGYLRNGEGVAAALGPLSADDLD